VIMAGFEIDQDFLKAFGGAPEPSTTKPGSANDLKGAFAEGSQAAEPSLASGAVAPFVGFNKALMTLGKPVDWISSGISAVTGLPEAEAPFGGSESIRRGLSSIGADPTKMEPRSTVEKYLQAGGEGIGGAFTMGAVGPTLATKVAPYFPNLAKTIEMATAFRAPVGASRPAALAPVAEMAVPAFTGGMGAEAASDLVPESWKGIAGLGGGLAGGAVGALGVAGSKAIPTMARAGMDYFAPLTEGGRQRLAQEKVVAGMGSPLRTREILTEETPDLVPGSKPTLFQKTGDQATGQLERQAESLSPAPFIERRGEQNAARIEALNKAQPSGAPEELPNFLRSKLADIEEGTTKSLEGATARAAEETRLLGGTQTPEAYGQTLRQSTEDARKAARTARSDLYKAIDPDNKLNAITTPIREMADNVLGGMTEHDAPLSGEPKAIFELAQKMGDVLPFKNLDAFDKRITAAISAERRAVGESPILMRLSQLKGAVVNSIVNSAENQHNWEQAAVAAGKMAPEDTLASRMNAYAEKAGEAPVVTGKPTAFQADLENAPVYHPNGQINVKYQVVDAPDLITSHDKDFRLRSDYPQELQPRNRAAGPAQDQVNEIASKLQPERLGPSPEVNSGAPIIGPDNIVESGNGRTLAIQKAYDAGRGNEYRAWLESQGYDTTGMKQPMLVGRRLTDMTPDERVKFAQSANTPTGLGMGAVEQAASDARLLGDISAPISPGPLSSAANQDFVRAVMERLPASERRNFLNDKGELSSGGEKRLQAALSSSAYDDPAFIRRAFESTDNNIKGIADAMTSVAGPWSKMRQAAANGDIAPEHDITDNLMDAVRMVMRARDEGKPLGFYLKQSDMFNSPIEQMAKDIIMPNGEKVASSKAISASLRNYAEEAQKNLAGERLFGETLKPEEVLRTSLGKAEKEAIEPTIAAEAKPTRKNLEPNMTPEAVEASKAAKAAHAEYAKTYKQGTVNDVLRTTGFSGQYRTPNATVVGKFFPAGANGEEAAMAFRKAVGDDAKAISTMQDYISWSARRAAEREDGSLDPKKFATWRKTHDSALRAFPELAGRFDNALDASKRMAELAVARKGAVDDFQRGAIGRVLKVSEPEDVVKTVGSIFNQTNAVGQMKALADATAGSQYGGISDGRAGLRRAIAEYVNNKFISPVESATSGQGTIKSASFQTFLKNNEAALTAKDKAGRSIFSPKELEAWKAIGEDLNRANRSISGNALPGRSTTAQDILPSLKQAEQSNLGLLAKMAIGMGAGYETRGTIGAAGGVLGAIGNHIIGNARNAGLTKVQDMVVEILLHPELALPALERVSSSSKPAGNTLAAAFKRLPVYGLNGAGAGKQEDANDYAKIYGEKNDNTPEPRPLTIHGPANRFAGGRIGRASGGKVAHNIQPLVSRLMGLAEQAKKSTDSSTKPLLDAPDASIVKALRVANQAI